MDARPFKAAVGNAVMGKGFESADNYKNTVVHFLNIDNIHAIRGCMERMVELCASDSSQLDESSWYQKLGATQWLSYVRIILQSCNRIVNTLGEEAASVVAHCSDGWDRTSQLCALTKLLIDPYYRTRKGFAVLIEQEWLSFGHKFAERHGHAFDNYTNDQRAPIFLQVCGLVG